MPGLGLGEAYGTVLGWRDAHSRGQCPCVQKGAVDLDREDVTVQSNWGGLGEASYRTCVLVRLKGQDKPAPVDGRLGEQPRA